MVYIIYYVCYVLYVILLYCMLYNIISWNQLYLIKYEIKL